MVYDYAAIVTLADPTRRRVFELVVEAPRSVASLARVLPVSQPAISYHLKILREARLVRATPQGASNIYYLDRHGLGEMRAWLDHMWSDALDTFHKEINDSKEQK